MEFTLTIKMDNAAFKAFGEGAESVELGRILRELSDKLPDHPHFSDGHSQSVRDYNGNECGYFTVKGE